MPQKTSIVEFLTFAKGENSMATTSSTLRRSNDDQVVAGVIGGIASFFQIDSSRLRLVYAIVGFFSGIIPSIILTWYYCS